MLSDGEKKIDHTWLLVECKGLRKKGLSAHMDILVKATIIGPEVLTTHPEITNNIPLFKTVKWNSYHYCGFSNYEVLIIYQQLFRVHIFSIT